MSSVKQQKTVLSTLEETIISKKGATKRDDDEGSLKPKEIPRQKGIEISDMEPAIETSITKWKTGEEPMFTIATAHYFTETSGSRFLVTVAFDCHNLKIKRMTFRQHLLQYA